MGTIFSSGLSAGLEEFSSFTLGRLNQEVIFYAFVLLLVGALTIPMILKQMKRLLSKNRQLESIQTFLLGSARVGLWFFLLIMVAQTVGIPVSSIFTLLGVVGLALSLALQNTLSNLAGGLQVLASKPFVVGDYIDTDQGSGTVVEIGLAYSKLLTIDNKEVLIPNHLVASSKIINHTASGVRRVDLLFSASYTHSTPAVREAILAACEDLPQIHQDPAPEVFLSEFGDSAIVYSLRVWTKAEDYWPVHFQLKEQVRSSFDKHGIEIPYNHINVHIHNQEGDGPSG